MQNNFIQMAVSASHAVAYTIGPIFFLENALKRQATEYFLKFLFFIWKYNPSGK